MKIDSMYLVGAVIIVLGLRIVLKGYAAKSKARMMLGAAAVPVGISLFFEKMPALASGLLGLGVALFVASLLMLRRQISALRASQEEPPSAPPPGQPRRRRRR